MSNIYAVATVNKTKPSHASTDSPSRHPRPARLLATGPLFDTRFRRHVDHLVRLGVRPVGECLLQLVGTNDDARIALIVVLEQYQRLDADFVKALGEDRWPTTIFPVEP